MSAVTVFLCSKKKIVGPITAFLSNPLVRAVVKTEKRVQIRKWGAFGSKRVFFSKQLMGGFCKNRVFSPNKKMGWCMAKNDFFSGNSIWRDSCNSDFFVQTVNGGV